MDPGAELAGEEVLPELTTTVLPSNGQVCGYKSDSYGTGTCFAATGANWFEELQLTEFKQTLLHMSCCVHVCRSLLTALMRDGKES